MGRRPVTTIIFFVFTAILVPVLANEFVDWLPWVATRLIRRAAGHLPLRYRARYVEEWKAEFNALPGGKLTKLLFGLRVYAGARNTGAVLQKLQEQRDMDIAARVLALAQQTADLAIADARREADETLGRARREADKILANACREADEVRARARAGRDEPPERLETR